MRFERLYPLPDLPPHGYFQFSLHEIQDLRYVVVASPEDAFNSLFMRFCHRPVVRTRSRVLAFNSLFMRFLRELPRARHGHVQPFNSLFMRFHIYYRHEQDEKTTYLLAFNSLFMRFLGTWRGARPRSSRSFQFSLHEILLGAVHVTKYTTEGFQFSLHEIPTSSTSAYQRSRGSTFNSLFMRFVVEYHPSKKIADLDFQFSLHEIRHRWPMENSREGYRTFNSLFMRFLRSSPLPLQRCRSTFNSLFMRFQ